MISIIFAVATATAGQQVRFDGQKIINAGDLSQATVTSSIVNLSTVTGYSIACAYSGSSPTGTLKIQVSNDFTEDSTAISNWYDLPSSSQSISANGNYVWAISDANYKWLKVLWTKTSGTGTINCFYGTKH